MVTPSLTVGDIINVISSLNNSSAGYDEMPASILKKCIDEYITPITYLVNLSIIPAGVDWTVGKTVIYQIKFTIKKRKKKRNFIRKDQNT